MSERGETPHGDSLKTVSEVPTTEAPAIADIAREAATRYMDSLSAVDRVMAVLGVQRPFDPYLQLLPATRNEVLALAGIDLESLSDEERNEIEALLSSPNPDGYYMEPEAARSQRPDINWDAVNVAIAAQVWGAFFDEDGNNRE